MLDLNLNIYSQKHTIIHYKHSTVQNTIENMYLMVIIGIALVG